MTGAARIALLLYLWLGASTAAWGQEAGKRIVLQRPALGETVTVEIEPGAILEVAFPVGGWQLRPSGDDVLLRFDLDGDGRDDSILVLQDLATEALRHSVVFEVTGVIIPADGVLAQAEALMGEPDGSIDDVAASEGAEDPDPRLSLLAFTGRDILFPGESERDGHPLYSYLLYAGTSRGDREERLRFQAAAEAFIGEVRSVESLESSGARSGEINIFYAPMKAIFEDTTAANMRLHFNQIREQEKQVALLLDLYDYARAQVLIARMRLSGDGPYIVSVLRPLSREPAGENEAFLVQDLSSVPPQLVALWVDEFKRQVVQEAAESPEHLRRLALNLRTQISVLAEAFAITRSAVAEMFQQPASGSGN